MDLNKSLRLAIDTGKVSVGAKQSNKAILYEFRKKYQDSTCVEFVWLAI